MNNAEINREKHLIKHIQDKSEGARTHPRLNLIGPEIEHTPRFLTAELKRVQRCALARKRLGHAPHSLLRIDGAKVRLPPWAVRVCEPREVELQLTAVGRDRLQSPYLHGHGGRGVAVGARLVVLGLDGGVDEGCVCGEGDRRLADLEAEVEGAELDDRRYL